MVAIIYYKEKYFPQNPIVTRHKAKYLSRKVSLVLSINIHLFTCLLDLFTFFLLVPVIFSCVYKMNTCQAAEFIDRRVK